MTNGPNQDLLRTLLTPSSKFGPASADEMPDDMDEGVLFDTQNEIDEWMRSAAPVFLVGRRGSGKTAFLKSRLDGRLRIDLNTPELIAKVGETLTAMKLTRGGEIVERVVPVWDACLTAAACTRLWSSQSNADADAYPFAFEFGRLNSPSSLGRPTDGATRFLHQVREQARSNPDYPSVATLIDGTEVNQIPLWAAQRDLRKAVDDHQIGIVASLDSLDQYSGMLFEGGALGNEDSFALQGLFRAASKTGRSANPLYRVRVSFPAELWHAYFDLSTNPLKDFDNTVLLHWENHELLRIAGKRLLKYLELHEPDEFRSITVPSRSRSARSRWAQDLFLRYLPPTVVNRLGQREPTVAYLLRHTQLLPRHFITILNHVFRDERPLEPRCIDESDLIRGVEQAEGLILDAIINAYWVPHPRLRSLCETLLENLAPTFSMPEFEVAYKRSPKVTDDSLSALSILTEVGAIGRVTQETALYRRADFEYLHANRLMITEDDTLCMHPLFSRRYGRTEDSASRQDARRPVLPLGSDPGQADEFTRYIHLTRTRS